jgi:DNA polymerase III delta prime subunit
MELAWLICGPAGCGKSTWVYKRAKETGARLLRHCVRTDRSLRQGRPLLFSQHRSAEPTLIWLEGADTLTMDAQAFLRRILETAGTNVEFVLEVRDESTMSPPLISRCRRFVLPPLSHRKRGFLETIEKRGYADLRKVYTTNIQRGACWSPGVGSNLTHSIVQAKASGLDPEQLINNVLKTTPLELQLETYKKLGEGVSPWILLAHVCLRSAVAA